jgi:molecular chaperone GrpE
MTHHKNHPKDLHPPDGGKAGPAPASQEGAAPPLPDPSPPGETVQNLRAGPDALQAERDDLLARLQRLSAEFVNYQKRVQRDIAQAREFANEELIKSLLPVVDDMERALNVARQNQPADDPLRAGMELVHSKALQTLERFGLTRISAKEELFDPERHAALMEQPSDRHPPRTVLQELQAGYQLKGRTIRPAHVVVSKEHEPAAQAKDEDQKEGKG